MKVGSHITHQIQYLKFDKLFTFSKFKYFGNLLIEYKIDFPKTNLSKAKRLFT